MNNDQKFAGVEGFAAARRAAGISQARIASFLGVYQVRISSMERGETRVSSEMLLELNKALGALTTAPKQPRKRRQRKS